MICLLHQVKVDITAGVCLIAETIAVVVLVADLSVFAKRQCEYLKLG